jgi:hypothetical protein
MSCENETSNDGSDSLAIKESNPLFDRSDTGWLLGQAVRYLNTDDKKGEFAYARVAELLRRCGNDLLENVGGIFKQVKSGDSALRWNLLYVLGDAGDGSAVEFLVRAALKPLPESQAEGCESDRDMEMLVNTMAVHALHNVAGRHPEASEAVLEVIAKRPAQPILIEAVKVADKLGLKEKVRQILSEQDTWILDIRQARREEVVADPERKDEKERGFTPPKSGALYTAPSAVCCTKKEK